MHSCSFGAELKCYSKSLGDILPGTQRDPLAAWKVLNRGRQSFVAAVLCTDFATPSRPKPHHVSWNLLPVKSKKQDWSYDWRFNISIYSATLHWCRPHYPVPCGRSWSVGVDVQVALQGQRVHRCLQKDNWEWQQICLIRNQHLQSLLLRCWPQTSVCDTDAKYQCSSGPWK